MPRKLTIEELKNRRDYNAWKIELDGYNMTDTHKRYYDAVRELEARESERTDILKDTLWKAAASFFGINITPDKLKEYFEQMMNDNRNAGMVRKLKEEEEMRVKAIEAEDSVRLAKLRSDHATLVDRLEKAKNKAAVTSDSDSEDTAIDLSTASESVVVIEELSESECEADEYMNDSEDYME